MYMYLSTCELFCLKLVKCTLMPISEVITFFFFLQIFMEILLHIFLLLLNQAFFDTSLLHISRCSSLLNYIRSLNWQNEIHVHKLLDHLSLQIL